MMRTKNPDSLFCAREPEVLDAVASGRLSRQHGAESNLFAHIAECDSCRDLADVTQALFEEQEAAWAEPAVPTADVVWLRAQLRARAEATRLASRPVAIVQAIGVACAAGAIAGVVGSGVWWLRSWATWLSEAATVLATGPSSIDMMGLAVRGVLLAAAVWLVLAPVAVYLAATDE
jgi:hypothetical protein